MDQATEVKTKEIPEHKTWKSAFMASPGPRCWLTTVLLFLKGVCMGMADVIPGVSGGTIAFVTGIYEDFVKSIASFDATFIKRLFKFKWKEGLAYVNLRFMLVLCSGISLAIISSAKTMGKLMENHPVLTWAAFFGLIAGSIVVVFREIKNWCLWKGILVLLGAVAAWLLCGLIPVDTPDGLWFIFVCGIIGICAMVLPGLSGSFLLLVLGKYRYIIGAVSHVAAAAHLALRMDFSGAYAALVSTGAFWILVVFQAGQLVGVVGFSRVLKWLLAHKHEQTMCVLAGLMIGAMRKIWPWKHNLQVLVIEKEKNGEIQHKAKVMEEILVLPGQYAQEFSQKVTTMAGDVTNTVQKTVSGLDPKIGLSVGLMIAGFVGVLALEWLARGKSHEPGDTEEI